VTFGPLATIASFILNSDDVVKFLWSLGGIYPYEQLRGAASDFESETLLARMRILRLSLGKIAKALMA